MQTIGNSTNKMDFPKTWTDILLKSISGKTNYTIDVKIGTKRIATDNQEQRESPKKRRKQSNPTRISANEENSNRGLGAEQALRSDGTEREPDRVGPPKDLGQQSNAQRPSPPPPSLLPLNLTTCDSQRPSAGGPRRNYPNSVYQHNDSPPTEMPPNKPSAPYQPFVTRSIACFEKTADCHPAEHVVSFKSPPSNPAANCGLPAPVQIFNPEAFCDQCNKEFCNKYFLKTHKANKHGVFAENVAPPAGGPSAAPDQTDRYREPAQVAAAAAAAATTSDHSCSSDVPAAAWPSPFKNPSASVPQCAAARSNAIHNNQPRALCNVCQKEFCNKYFVKRHKAKIHGITDDGDGKTAVDDDAVPLNFKNSLRAMRVDDDELYPAHAGVHVPDAWCDRDDESCGAGPPMYRDAQGSWSRVPSKAHAQSQTRPADTDELARGPDEEHGGVADKRNGHHANDGETMRNDAFKRTVDTGAVVLGLMVTGNGDRSEDDGEEEHEDGVDEEDVEKEFMSRPGFAENDEGADHDGGTGTEDHRGPQDHKLQIGRSKALTLHDLFFKLNDDGALENMPKCHECSATAVDGSVNKHDHQLVNDSFKCEWTGGGAKGAGGASTTSSKNSGGENYDDVARHGGAAAGERNDKPSAATLSSFCKICNKELCNKYFMKTHMERMHGISIRNGNHIGGVVCDICNKELCSKYFLRVHKLNSHGVGGGADNGPSRYWLDAAAAENRPVEGPPQTPQTPQPPVDGPQTLAVDGPQQQPPPPDDDHRYYKHYTESCAVCLRRFRSAKWLNAHLLNDHGDEGRAQWARNAHNRPAADEHGRPRRPPQRQWWQKDQDAADPREDDDAKRYRCSYCPFATSVLSFLFVHEKFHVTESANKAADAATPPDTDGRSDSPSSDRHQRRANIGAESGGHEPFIMQSFFLENCSVSPSVKADADSFHSSLVYLPVKEKLTSTVNVFFKLTPT